MPNYRKHLARTRAIQRERRARRDEPPCFCGGDFCVCHNHGEALCSGCRACEGSFFDDDGDDYDDYDDWYTDYVRRLVHGL